MTGTTSFVAWQPVLTDHQAYTLQALSEVSGRPLRCMVLRTEDPVRKAQGWQDTQVTSVERRVLPANLSLRQLWQMMGQARDAVHLFGSPFDQPQMMRALAIAAIRRLDFYLISEPYSPGDDGYFGDGRRLLNRFKALLRPWVYRVYGLTVGRRARGIFAISSLAVEQYSRAGVPRDRLFPFGYFVPPVAMTVRPKTAAHAPGLRLVFVGSLIRRKGVDLLIEAVNALRSEGHAVTLDAYGPGYSADRATDHGFDGISVRHCGLIPFGHAQATIASYDALVLPSRYDGWGVVVNEALLAGVQVVCSDRVGAKVLVETFGAGTVFASGQATALGDCLRALLNDPARMQRQHECTRRAAAAIEPVAAARYMWAVIQRHGDALASQLSPWYARLGR